MALTELSLPIDIPWKRMGFSADMIDDKGGDLTFPKKWLSSVAVFYHEPPEVPPEYCKRRITYIKVCCTITNYQHPHYAEEQPSSLDELRKLGWEYTSVPSAYLNNFDYQLTQSLPCHGALVQVGVYPNPKEDVEPQDFPYISSFQPRKREMYETRTESGEVASQSASRLNVGKTMTNLDTAEDYDLLTGESWSKSSGGSGSLFFGLVGGSGQSSRSESKTGQWGNIDRSQSESRRVMSVDASREKREALSHTTNVNQIYSLLQGFHLGTNRAVFLLQPRPHIQSSPYTFVRGLRRLEGIQEFLLVVNRPASVPGICVEVALETAHLGRRRAYRARIIAASDLYHANNLAKTPAALNLQPTTHWDKRMSQLVWSWNAFHLWRSSAHAALRSTWPLDPQLAPAPTATAYQYWNDLLQAAAYLPENYLGDAALIYDEFERDDGYLIVTGRRLYSCTSDDEQGCRQASDRRDEEREEASSALEQRPAVSVESSVPSHRSIYKEEPSVVFQRRYTGPSADALGGPLNVTRDNAIIQDINHTLMESVGSPDRVPYNELSFSESDFVLEELSQVARLLKQSGVADRELGDCKSFKTLMKRGLGKRSGVRTLLDAAEVSTEDIARDLEISEIEARKNRARLLVAVLRELDVKTVEKCTPLNPTQEAFLAEYTSERLEQLERSALHQRTEHDRRPPSE